MNLVFTYLIIIGFKGQLEKYVDNENKKTLI
jgi:hypothetical protein